ncbi:MAG: ribosomal L7Ae/L30e/S12e/Gadd45 family protein [Oscillospiraceae bacterium]|nr:ribosomal L7Ae/L30e/S12e/Gadd45 family protein [Oscillospiraceae bacterium]
MLQELKTAKKVVGVKQLRKVLREGNAERIYLAEDADPRLTESIAADAESAGVPVSRVPTMAELGAACAIDVGAAAVAIVR